MGKRETMKRDLTVWLALLLIGVPWGIGIAMGMPEEITNDSPTLFQVFFWLMFLGSLRATILWFQTLIHGIKYAKEENRVILVLCHIFIGPIMSYLYYITLRLDAKREAHFGQESDIDPQEMQQTRLVK